MPRGRHTRLDLSLVQRSASSVIYRDRLRQSRSKVHGRKREKKNKDSREVTNGWNSAPA